MDTFTKMSLSPQSILEMGARLGETLGLLVGEVGLMEGDVVGIVGLMEGEVVGRLLLTRP
jgi:hypothetical protein